MDRSLVYRGRLRRTSLFLFGLTFFFGGLPLVVYFTEPGATWVCLALGISAVAALFGLSLRALLTQTALIVEPVRRRFRHCRRVYLRGLVTEAGYEQVSRMEWDDESGFPTRAAIVLKDGSELDLGEPATRGDAGTLEGLPSEFGVEARVRPAAGFGTSAGGAGP